MTVSFPAVAPALALTACLLPYQVYNSYFAPTMKVLQCFDAVGWAAGRASGL